MTDYKKIEDYSNAEVSPVIANVVEKLLSQKDPWDILQKDVFFILIIALMLENDYVLCIDDEECHASQIYDNLQKWKYPGGFLNITFFLNGFKEVMCQIIVAPIGSVVLVNVILPQFNTETYSTCIELNKYVHPQRLPYPKLFHNLKLISIIFKDHIATPVKSRILSHYGYSSASLIGLPEDVFPYILSKLSYIDLCNLSEMCWRLRNIIQAYRKNIRCKKSG